MLVINKWNSRFALVRFFLITRMITDRTGLHSVLLLLIIKIEQKVKVFMHTASFWAKKFQGTHEIAMQWK